MRLITKLPAAIPRSKVNVRNDSLWNITMLLGFDILYIFCLNVLNLDVAIPYETTEELAVVIENSE